VLNMWAVTPCSCNSASEGLYQTARCLVARTTLRTLCTAYAPTDLFLYLFLSSVIGSSFASELLRVFLIVLYGLLHVVVSILGYLE